MSGLGGPPSTGPRALFSTWHVEAFELEDHDIVGILADPVGDKEEVFPAANGTPNGPGGKAYSWGQYSDCTYRKVLQRHHLELDFTLTKTVVECDQNCDSAMGTGRLHD